MLGWVYLLWRKVRRWGLRALEKKRREWGELWMTGMWMMGMGGEPNMEVLGWIQMWKYWDGSGMRHQIGGRGEDRGAVEGGVEEVEGEGQGWI